MEKPCVCIARSVWSAVVGEVEHFASLPTGLTEAAVYPMFGFARRPSCLKPPWSMIELDDIESFVLTHAFVPPRGQCAHTMTRVIFVDSPDGAPPVFQQVQIWADEVFQAHPRLDLGNIHSHPFARGWTQPSGTDRGRVIACLQSNRGRSLNVGLEIILCKDVSSPDGWKACCFALSDEGSPFQSLGSAEIVDDGDERVISMLSSRYRDLPDGIGREWEDRQRSNLEGLELFQDFPFGWSGARVRLGEGAYFLVYFPPSFPAADAVLYQSADSVNRVWGEMKRWVIGRDGFALDLSIIASAVSSEVMS